MTNRLYSCLLLGILQFAQSSYPADAIRMELEPVKRQFKIDEPILCEFRMTNTSENPIFVPTRMWIPSSLRLTLRDGDGNEILYMGIVVSLHYPEPYEFVQLDQNEFFGKTLHLSYGARDGFDITAPGTYELSGVYENYDEKHVRHYVEETYWKGRVELEPVTIEIIAAEENTESI